MGNVFILMLHSQNTINNSDIGFLDKVWITGIGGFHYKSGSPRILELIALRFFSFFSASRLPLYLWGLWKVKRDQILKVDTSLRVLNVLKQISFLDTTDLSPHSGAAKLGKYCPVIRTRQVDFLSLGYFQTRFLI